MEITLITYIIIILIYEQTPQLKYATEFRKTFDPAMEISDKVLKLSS